VADANTLVLIVGDNGTPGEVIQPPFVPQHAKRSIYEQGIRSALIAFGAGVAAPGRTSNALVHVVDFWRTCAAVAGVPPLGTPGLARDSISFLPVLENPAAPSARQRIFCESFKPNGPPPHSVELRTLLDGSYKLLNIAGHEEFYRIETDPTELHDLLVEGMTPAET